MLSNLYGDREGQFARTQYTLGIELALADLILCLMPIFFYLISYWFQAIFMQKNELKTYILTQKKTEAGSLIFFLLSLDIITSFI